MTEFRAGRVLQRSVAVWGRNPALFTALACMAYAPLILATLVLLGGDMSAGDMQAWMEQRMLGTITFGCLTTGLVVQGVLYQLRNRRPGLKDCLGAFLPRFLPVLGVSILSEAFILLGMMALVLPGLIIALVLEVAVPVAVVERRGVWASLVRSKDMTAGYLFHILVIYAVFILASLGLQEGLDRVFLGGSGTMAGVRLRMLAELAVIALLGGLGGVASAVTYHELRVAKEGPDSMLAIGPTVPPARADWHGEG